MIETFKLPIFTYQQAITMNDTLTRGKSIWENGLAFRTGWGQKHIKNNCPVNVQCCSSACRVLDCLLHGQNCGGWENKKWWSVSHSEWELVQQCYYLTPVQPTWNFWPANVTHSTSPRSSYWLSLLLSTFHYRHTKIAHCCRCIKH